MSIPWGTVKLQFAKYFEVLSTVIESFLSMSISLLLSIFFNKEALKKNYKDFRKPWETNLRLPSFREERTFFLSGVQSSAVINDEFPHYITLKGLKIILPSFYIQFYESLV